MKLLYDKPATRFLEGIATGNGRIGAVNCGGVVTDTVYLNDDSVWYGDFRDRVNPDARESIEHLRELIFAGKVWQAEKTAFLTLTATPESERAYQPIGMMHFKYYYPQSGKESLDFLHDDYNQIDDDIKASEYKRWLCLDTAVSSVEYKVCDVAYKREIFASNPSGVIAIKLTANKKGALSFTARLNREKQYDYVKKTGENTLVMGGRAGGNGVDFALGAQVHNVGGTAQIIGQHIVVQNACEAVIYMGTATSFYEKNCDLSKHLADKLKAFGLDDYYEVRGKHIADYSAIFSRVNFKLLDGKDEKENMPTDERIKLVQNGQEDVFLQGILYQYGRYLHISSSRNGNLPMNLRGIWNHEFAPAWDSKFTININQQMMYWASDMCNMSECGEPLFALLERMCKNGKTVARDMYGCSGFVAHHNTDLWADCAPQDIHRAAFWCLGAAWLSLHIWDCYDYNKDEAFLQKYFYVLQEAVRFVLDYLVFDKEGFLVTCPSHSPENGYFLQDRSDVKPSITYAPTMDNMLIRHLFLKYCEAATVLSEKDDLYERVMAAVDKLHPTKIGKHGQIMEWVEDYDEPEPGHRHMAHLFGLHPADEITLFKTPKLAKAAMASIDRRLAHQKQEDGKNGWTLSWMMLFEARLGREQHAYNYIINMIKNAVAPNLFGLCVTDEIYVLDGNVGMTVAMTELIVQSQAGEIYLLPALPEQWHSGELSGIKARGGFVISIEWQDEKLKSATVLSCANTSTKLRTKTAVSVWDEGGKNVIAKSKQDVCGTWLTEWKALEDSKYLVQ